MYHKSSRGHNVDSSKIAADEDEYHAYLIISLEARTMVYFASVFWSYFIRSSYFDKNTFNVWPFRYLKLLTFSQKSLRVLTIMFREEQLLLEIYLEGT